MLWLDFETSSQVDLKVNGVARYAQSLTTKIICLAWAVGDDDVQVWWSDEPIPTKLKDALLSNCPVYAHNADFERQIFDYVMENDFGVGVDISRWRCSMVQALTNGLPAKLDELGNALDLPVKKQQHGTRLIREYCAPNHLTEFKEGDKQLMEEYARDDVVVMRYAVQSMRELTDEEWGEYHLTCRINDRGIPVDVPFVTASLEYADDIAAEVGGKLADLTDGMMTKHTQRKGRDAWLHPRLTDEHMKLMEVWKNGKKKLSLDQEHRDILLSRTDLDDGSRQLLNLINDAGSAALKKYGAAANQHVNGRVHNTFQFHGAQTGRFSGRGIQPHNFRRDAYDDEEAETLIGDIIDGYEIDEPSTTMARLLRPMIYSKKGISYVDWSAIEGRVAPWLANSELGERKLDLYRDEKDVYVETAAEMFNLDPDDVDKEKRQSGKISELSLQFGGGAGALQGMAKNYGVTFSDAEAERLVNLWRRSNQWAVQLWPKFEKAAYSAVKNVGKPFQAELCTFQSDGSFLWCALPSGRLLAYYAPTIELVETPWGEERVAATFQTTIKMKQEDIKKQEAGERPFYRNVLRGALLMQNCIGRDEKVLTDRGWIDIQTVKADDLVFDGVDFVSHGGLVYQSVKEVGSVDGVNMTPDHKVYTKRGWVHARVTRQICGPEIRVFDSTRDEWRVSRKSTIADIQMRLRNCHSKTDESRDEGETPILRMSDEKTAYRGSYNPRYVASSGLRGVGQYASEVQQPATPSVQKLWRKGYKGLRALVKRVSVFLGGYGFNLQAGLIVRQVRQRAGLPPLELCVEDKKATSEQYTIEQNGRDTRGADDRSASGGSLWCQKDDTTLSSREWLERPASYKHRGGLQQPVYDIKNCGPRNQFVVLGDTQPFIVHNCTQGVAADILRRSLVRADAEGLPVILSVHDEIGVEGGIDLGEKLNRIMLEVPIWAGGLPLATGGVEHALRYGK